MVLPEECKTITEVRDAIDVIDKEIISLLGRRFHYVKEIVRFKSNSEDSIKAKPRYDAVIKSRMSMAENCGLNGEVIGEVYKTLLDYFITEQKRIINPE